MNKKHVQKTVALTLICTLSFQIVYPNRALALTSGPSQPEVQSFEPVGTTDMVDLFSGDFVYNIPLLDVEGYPINISYHSGVNVEQEASWVGLGWNINPGVINRAVRGVPDDFDGDVLEKKLHIKPEKNIVVGSDASFEIFGKGLSLSAGFAVTSNNYRGVGLNLHTGVSFSAFGFASTGVNMSISSQNGADIDYGASLGYSTSSTLSRDFCGGVGVNASSGYNTRSGMKDINLSISANYKSSFEGKKISGGGNLFSTSIPIGLQNYVPVITNKTTLTGWGASIGAGGEVYGCYIYGNMSLTMSKLTYDEDGSRHAFGYMYLQDAENIENMDILDFTRDKDGMFNKTMQYLPPAATTYDVYSVSAQGSGGIFRPMRNDNGFVYDPTLKSHSDTKTGGLEVGLGNLFELGGNYTHFTNDMTSGPWDEATRSFSKKSLGSVFENVYFKQAGELTEAPQSYYNSINTSHPLSLTTSNLSSLPQTKDSAYYKRDPRGNLIYYLTSEEAAIPEMSFSMQQLQNYTDTAGLIDGPSAAKSLIDRTNSTTRPNNRIGEIIQVNKDGSRYVYGLPELNNIQKEATFSVENPGNVNAAEGTTTYSSGQDNLSNSDGQENYYSCTVTPAYAHSYLLTDVYSTDYVDVTGNGPSDDDLGSYTKFNYSRKESDYRWKTPYSPNTAQYSAGFYCDKKDDKASYVEGSKEEWYLHSIETKNFVAEFYTSPRLDGKGAEGSLFNMSSMYTSGAYASEPYTQNIAHNDRASSYKLDSIVLYNKHDRYINQENAVPIKSIYFEYNYSLCGGTPNSDASTAGDGSINGGKLVLKKIYMKYGNSDKNLLSPYQFNYSSFNPSYNSACKDRWGNYKVNNSSAPNYEFPYVDQDANNDQNASAWLLNSITLPSGGTISVDYESDDYAYVQNKRAMEMFQVQGVGASTNYHPNDYTLYTDKNSPFTYIYFKRRQSDEIDPGNIQKSYFEGQSLLYYNFGVDIASRGTYEFVRGYADIESVGVCPDNSDYAYVKVSAKKPQGSSSRLSPITYTGLNMARYYLPHLFYPGSDPDESNLENILKGLAYSIGDIINFGKNPLERFVKENKAKNYNKSRSFIRLTSPGLSKSGGGSRVKQIKINDSWNAMAGGDNTTGEYGNNYDYTKDKPGYGTISSGVASYEPLIGGDENPFRMPANYMATNGGHFPPNDPVELYQEEPIGESLYPTASVGYSKVTVTGIHKGVARSEQTQDEYEFYTAEDFPIRVEHTAASKWEENSHKLLKSKESLKATQAYSIIMNDMHGKPKAIRNYVFKGDQKFLVTGQSFIYNATGNTLNNNVQVVDYSNNDHLFYKRNGILGVDIDVTVDSRSKEEHTHTSFVQGNLNTFLVWIIPIPIPTAFFPSGDHDRIFKSLVCTKVVQQYGILKSVETIKEGAKYFKQNELFDRESGEVLLTKSNNEFRDTQFNMNYPAYWAYRGMGPSYRNILYEDSVSRVSHQFIDTFITSLTGPHGGTPFEIGDELLCTLSLGTQTYHFKLWITKAVPLWANARYRSVIPTNVLDAIRGHAWFRAKVIRSGYRNMLTDPMQVTNSLDYPQIGTPNFFSPSKVISTNVTTYSDSLVNSFDWHGDFATDTINRIDTNKFIWGYRGNYRVAQKLTYLTNRDYSANHDRYDGTFPISTAYWMMDPQNSYVYSCYSEPTKNHAPAMVNPAAVTQNVTVPWKPSQTVIAYNMWGNELEDQDALKVPSTAVFGFNHTQPTAVASNAKRYEVLSESFEDYRQLYLQSWTFNYSPIRPYIAWTTVPSYLDPYKILDSAGTTGSNWALTQETSHTGKYSLKVSGGNGVINVYTDPYLDNRANHFSFDKNKKYIISIWAKGSSPSVDPTVTARQYDGGNAEIANTAVSLSQKSNVIDGWKLYEGTVNINAGAEKVTITLPTNFYYDDLRAFPSDGNMKAFVYNPVNQKLIATLDENNFATMYEYDNEGQLIRINKETERGILTVQESRNANVKQ